MRVDVSEILPVQTQEASTNSGKSVTRLQPPSGSQAGKRQQSLKFSSLKVDLSYFCPLECHHCLFEASPALTPRGMTDQDLFHVIQSSAEVGTFYSISIGQQEPFVEFRRLCAILRFLTENFDGYGVSLNTTATWVKSRAFARERLTLLKDLRVESLMISVDDFHQNQVPLEKCIQCAQAAQEVDIHVVIQCVYSKNSHRLGYYRARMEPHLDAEKIEWAENAFCPSGRARKVIPESDWPQESYEKGFCNIMETMYVAPDGSVTPCCGGGLVAKGLVAGNLHNESMAQIIAKIEQDPLLNCIAAYKGPAGLVKILEESHPTWNPREHYTGKCHACFEIMNDPSLVGFLRRELEDRKVELLLRRLYQEVHKGLFAVRPSPPGEPQAQPPSALA